MLHLSKLSPATLACMILDIIQPDSQPLTNDLTVTEEVVPIWAELTAKVSFIEALRLIAYLESTK